MKKLFTLLLCVVVCLSAVVVAYAETAPKTLKVTNYVDSSTPIKFPATFWVKKTTAGKYIYCVYYAKTTPNTNITYTKGSLVTDNGMNYILKQSYNAKNDDDHFIYQTALWMYMVDKGIMEGPHYTLTVFNSQLKNNSTATATKIKNLVANAKKAGANDTKAPTIKASNASSFAIDSTGKYYVATVNVTNSTGAYNVSLTSAPTGSVAEKNGNTVTIKVPVSAVKSLKTTVSYTVSNSKDIYTSYYYNPSNTNYQIMADVFKDTKTSSAKGSLLIEKTVSVPFLKVDAETNKAISGAELKLTNSAGTVIKTWISSDKAVVVSGLKEGTYTLTETKAPEGYKAIETSVKFSIDSEGKIKDSAGKEIVQVVITNEKKTGGVSISKQDITNKQELPGAMLVVKDSNGNIIDEWESTTEPHIIQKLNPGTYTLTETIAPDGYVLSTETITFTVKDDGSVTEVVMYNAPKGGVSISKQDITNKKELPGATLVVKDYDGNVIDTWVSTTEPHIIQKLEPGIYTLTETIAPDGYILSTETITFTVKDDGTITKVVMYNSPDGKDIPVEDTASFKTMTSSLMGCIVIIAGSYIIFKNSKKKESM